MSQLSRRALVASAAALPALAVPPTAFGPDHPDAELLRLAVQLREVERARVALLVNDCAFDAKWDAICSKAGLPKMTYGDRPSDDEWLKYLEARWPLRPQRDYIEDGEDDPWDELLEDRLNPLVEEILSLKATTVAGFAVQFRAALLADMDLLTGGTVEEKLLKAAAAFVGIDDPKRITEGGET